MFKKVICLLVLSLFTFNVFSSNLSFENKSQKIVLEEKLKELIEFLPVEAIEEIESLKDLDVGQSAPIVSDIIRHYTKEVGANYHHGPHGDDLLWWWVFFNFSEHPETAILSVVVLFAILFV